MAVTSFFVAFKIEAVMVEEINIPLLWVAPKG